MAKTYQTARTEKKGKTVMSTDTVEKKNFAAPTEAKIDYSKDNDKFICAETNNECSMHADGAHCYRGRDGIDTGHCYIRLKVK